MYRPSELLTMEQRSSWPELAKLLSEPDPFSRASTLYAAIKTSDPGVISSMFGNFVPHLDPVTCSWLLDCALRHGSERQVFDLLMEKRRTVVWLGLGGVLNEMARLGRADLFAKAVNLDGFHLREPLNCSKCCIIHDKPDILEAVWPDESLPSKYNGKLLLFAANRSSKGCAAWLLNKKVSPAMAAASAFEWLSKKNDEMFVACAKKSNRSSLMERMDEIRKTSVLSERDVDFVNAWIESMALDKVSRRVNPGRIRRRL